jgi:hypothetical protein
VNLRAAFPDLLRRRMRPRICPYCLFPIDEGSRSWRCRRPPPLSDAPPTAPVPAAGAGETAAPPPDADASEPLNNSYCDTLYRDSRGPCPRCGSSNPRVPVCPRCNAILPGGWHDRQSLSVGVLGESGSGKTHYIVALHSWWEAHLNRFSMSFLPEMPFVFERQFEEIRHQVISGRVLEPTDDKAYAFLWDIRQSTRSFFDRPFYFYYHDTAGENLADLDRTRPKSGYILAANMLLFLVDGERLRAVEAKLHPERPTAEVGADPGPAPMDAFRDAPGTMGDTGTRGQDATRGLWSVIKFLREQTNAGNKRLDVRIAVCLNKSDEVGRAFPGYRDAITKRPRHDAYFDLATCQHLSDVVEHYLREELKQGNLVELIRAHFSDHLFFPTATLGSGPSESGSMEYGHWSPLGVEDPFLWILWKQGHIPARHP